VVSMLIDILILIITVAAFLLLAGCVKAVQKL
jgi:hypothetical protein